MHILLPIWSTHSIVNTLDLLVRILFARQRRLKVAPSLDVDVRGVACRWAQFCHAMAPQCLSGYNGNGNEAQQLRRRQRRRRRFRRRRRQYRIVFVQRSLAMSALAHDSI